MNATIAYKPVYSCLCRCPTTPQNVEPVVTPIEHILKVDLSSYGHYFELNILNIN